MIESTTSSVAHTNTDERQHYIEGLARTFDFRFNGWL
jgi:hypothetical protein